MPETVGAESGWRTEFTKIGNDRTKWATDVPLYAGARASLLYAGIDAVYISR